MTALSSGHVGDLATAPEPIDRQLRAFADQFEVDLDGFLPPSQEAGAARVVEAMRYAALGGGKRVRPFLVMQSAGLVELDRSEALSIAAAVECIHCYSLVHDDLPAMDDDDVRRGRPTVHVAFDEATAILAGDALLTRAFEILSEAGQRGDKGGGWLSIVSSLARAAGTKGMIGGQMCDIQAEGQILTLQQITHLQGLKTGALIEWAVLAPADLAEVDLIVRSALAEYAKRLGLVFQITDDLLDYQGDADLIGKAVGKDEAAGKGTFVSHLGIEGARRRASELTVEAVDALAPFGNQADSLRSLARFVMNRNA
ncbi:MAG: polyprenyl synthetase family protein [Pseudomonadota bacterium]